MYHRISDDPEPGVHPYYRVCTSPARFREQMQWLKDHGYRGMTLGNALNSEFRIQNSEFLPVVVTFDDGFQDFYTTAWPILQEFGFTATMYLPTAFIGDERRVFSPGTKSATGNRQLAIKPPSTIHHPPSSNGSRACLTWSEVRELHTAGIEFGSHTVSHPKLTELSWPEIQSEIHDSKLEIENHLGVPCPAFAYPYAFPQGNPDFVHRFRERVATAGYRSNVTTQIGRQGAGDDRFQIKRLPVNQADDLSLFAAKLAGSYDWLGRIQTWSKKLRGTRHPNGRPVEIPALVSS